MAHEMQLFTLVQIPIDWCVKWGNRYTGHEDGYLDESTLVDDGSGDF